MDGKSWRHDLLKVTASPVPGGDLAPEAVRGLLGVGVHLRLIDVYDIAPWTRVLPSTITVSITARNQNPPGP